MLINFTLNKLLLKAYNIFYTIFFESFDQTNFGIKNVTFGTLICRLLMDGIVALLYPACLLQCIYLCFYGHFIV